MTDIRHRKCPLTPSLPTALLVWTGVSLCYTSPVVTAKKAPVPPVEDVRELQSTMSPEELCSFSQGTLDENGDCIVCLGTSRENCCVLDPTDFSARCDTFCTEVVYNAALQTFCGSASCELAGGTESLCVGSTSVVGRELNVTFTCGANSCTCQEATWDGQTCASCTGAGEGYDCASIGGPVKVPEESNVTSPSIDLPRPYRTDGSFLAEVESLSLPDASTLAGVPIGAAVAPGSPNLTDYVPSDYNMIVAENSMKWNRLLADGETLDVYDFSDADEMVDYAKSVGARVRGHALIWGRVPGSSYPSAVNTEVENSDDANSTVVDIMRRHITAVAGHFRGRVDVWDVVNEPLSSRSEDSNVFFATLGDDYMKVAFELAREVDGTAKLVWNEVVGNFDLDDPTIALWLQFLRRYKEEGVPLDGIGVQGHSINRLHNTTELAVFLRVVADMGYQVELTEVDAPINLFLDREDPFGAQGEFFAEYVRACLDSGGCAGVTFWGMTDAITWHDWLFPATSPNLPLLIDEEGYRKPAWLSVRQEFESYVEGGGVNSTEIDAETKVVEGENSENDAATSGGSSKYGRVHASALFAVCLASFRYLDLL